MTVFFVLSGFLIHYVNGADLLKGRSLRDFAAARIGRLYPLYLTVLLLTLIFTNELNGYPLSDAVRGLLLSLFLAQSWFFLEVGNAPASAFLPTFSLAWSISTEALMYAAYPFALIAVRLLHLSDRGKIAACLTAVFLLSALYHWAWVHRSWIAEVYVLLTQEPDRGSDFANWLVYHSPYARMAQFLVGAAAAQLFIQSRHLAISGKERMLAPLAVIGPPALMLILVWNAPVSGDLFLYTVLTAVTLFCWARYGGYFFTKQWRTVGDWTYGIYLMQFVVAGLFPPMSDPATRWIWVPLFWLTLILAAALAARYIEKPGKRIIVRSFRESRLAN